MKKVIESAVRRLMSMPYLLIVMSFVAFIAPPIAEATIYSTISGYVSNADSQQPIAGIEIVAIEKYVDNPRIARTLSNTKGLYVLKDVTPGFYTLYLEQNNNYYLEDKKKEVKVTQGKNVVSFNFYLRRAGSVSGKIYQGDGVTPYANMKSA